MWGWPVQTDEDKKPPWTECPDCGAPMIDDDGKSNSYCPICEENEYPW